MDLLISCSPDEPGVGVGSATRGNDAGVATGTGATGSVTGGCVTGSGEGSGTVDSAATSAATISSLRGNSKGQHLFLPKDAEKHRAEGWVPELVSRDG